MAMYRWKITIEAWPHSTGAGAAEDQAAAGERSTDFKVNARDLAHAYELARAIQMGVEVNPRVWRAPITAILQMQECTP